MIPVHAEPGDDVMRALFLTTACLALLAQAGCSQPATSKDAPSAGASDTASSGQPPATTAGAKPSAATDASADTSGTPAKAAAVQTTTPSARQAYMPVAISREDNPGRARQIRCQVGASAETDCTFTPLFGDGSFQLDGPDIALRMIITDGDGSLFEVISAEERVPIGSSYRRDTRDRACWVEVEKTSAPSRICAR